MSATMLTLQKTGDDLAAAFRQRSGALRKSIGHIEGKASGPGASPRFVDLHGRFTPFLPATVRLAADGADPVRFPHAVTATDAWDFLQKHKDAVLIDVRTKAEWMFVGVPDLSSLGNQLILLEWQVFPTMGMNRTFPEQLTKDLPDRKDVPLFFLCRSGARSQAAADVMAATGYAHCVNIADGFEGDLDPGRHRGRLNGWKASGLPWVQT